MKYAFKKITTSIDGYHTILPTTVDSVWTFDPNGFYENMTLVVWNPNPQGILLSGVNGHFDFFEGDTYVIVSYEDEDIVHYQYADANTLFVSKCTVVYSTQTLDSTFYGYLDFTQLQSNPASMWGSMYQIYDQVIDYVTDQNDMAFWLSYVRFSDKSRFFSSITDQVLIYQILIVIDDEDFFNELTQDQYLVGYASVYPTKADIVKPKITDPVWIEIWNNTFPDDQIIPPTPTPDPTDTPEPTPDPTDTPEVTETPEPTPDPTDTPEITETPEPTPDVTPTPSEV